MTRAWRAFFTFWVLGAAFTLWTGHPGPFHWAGVSRMDIFHTPSLEAARFHLAYFREDRPRPVLLPYMRPDGVNLGWLDNESFRYRTYFPVLGQLAASAPLNEARLRQAWRARQVEFARPALYDFCRQGRETARYLVIISDTDPRRAPAKFSLSFELDRGRFGPDWRARCERVAARWSPPSFNSDEARALDDGSRWDQWLGDDSIEVEVEAFAS